LVVNSGIVSIFLGFVGYAVIYAKGVPNWPATTKLVAGQILTTPASYRLLVQQFRVDISPKVSPLVIALKGDFRVAFHPYFSVIAVGSKEKTFLCEIGENLVATFCRIKGIEGIGIVVAVLVQTATSRPAVLTLAIVRETLAVNIVVLFLRLVKDNDFYTAGDNDFFFTDFDYHIVLVFGYTIIYAKGVPD
jgi:hypothetical protein